MIPWRMKNFVSMRAPVLFYLIGNLFSRRNSQTNWDELLAASWDDAARTWPNRSHEIRALTETHEKILDVGCGTGSILRFLKDSGYLELSGLEHSPLAVRRLAEYGINMHQGELPTINLPEETFDVVIASEVLEHMLWHRKFVDEICKVLKPEGRAFVFVPNNCLGPIDEPTHVRTYTAESLTCLLEDYGDVENVTETREDHFPAPFLFAVLRKKRYA